MRTKKSVVLACAISAAIGVAPVFAQAPKPNLPTQDLPRDSIPFVCLAHYVVLPREFDQKLFCKDHLAGLRLCEARRRTGCPRPPEDAFVEFVKARAAPDLAIALYRKSRWGKMVAIKGADGQVRLLFDYRGLRDALFAVEVRSGSTLQIDKDGGFLSVLVPADAAEILIFNVSPTPKRCRSINGSSMEALPIANGSCAEAR